MLTSAIRIMAKSNIRERETDLRSSVNSDTHDAANGDRSYHASKLVCSTNLLNAMLRKKYLLCINLMTIYIVHSFLYIYIYIYI